MRKILCTVFAMMYMTIYSAAAASCGGFRLAQDGTYAEEYLGGEAAACFPASVVKADYNLFQEGAESIRQLTLPPLMEEVPGLKNCVNLEKIEVPQDNAAFAGVDGVLYSRDLSRLIYYPRGKRDAAFQIPDSVREIAGGAFFGNPYLEEVVLPAGVASVGAENFTDCSALREIRPEEGNAAFTAQNGALYTSDCKTLIAVPAGNSGAFTVPEGTEKIAYGAFSGCSGLTELHLAETLTQIEAMAFAGCTGLRAITLPAALEQASAASFAGCSNLEAVYVEHSDYFQTRDGILYSRDMIDLIFCPAGKKGSIVLPDGVQNIANGAFDNCREMTALILPESVTALGRAFLNCENLEYISIPETISIIDYCTFMGCTGLEWVYFPNNVVIIKDKVFAGASPVIYCDEDSYAEMYAQDNGLPYQYMIRVELNGEPMLFDQPPVLVNDTTLVPLRAIFEALGAAVQWDGEQMTAQMGQQTAEVTVGGDIMYVTDADGTENAVRLDAPAQLINDRVLAPLRAVSEAFGADVQWDEKTKTILIEK